jgi:RNA polymerase sigma factor (sigma-70 family)
MDALEAMAVPTTGESAEVWLAANWRLLRTATGAVLSGPRHAGDAEDAAQDAALAIWRHWDDGYDARLGTRAAWAYAIARRRAIDYRRRQRTRHGTAAHARAAARAARDGGWDAVDLEALMGQRDEVRRAWRRLSPAERLAVALLAEGHSGTAAAAALHWPLGTLKSRLWHMRRRLAAGR